MKIGFLFDLDGVLIDSETEYTRIWQAIDQAFPTGVENFAIKIKGQTLPEILSQNFPEHLWPDVTAMLNEREQRMHYPPLPGAMEILAELKRRDIPRALVTSSNGYKMKHLREECPDLEGFFSAIVTADMISHSKPDPEGYLLGARLIGADPTHCVVFEDSRQGLTAGKAAGAYTVGLTTTLPASEIGHLCHRVIPNLASIGLDEVIDTLHTR